MSADRDPKLQYSYQEMVDRLRENRPEGSRVRSEEREVDPETGKVTVRRQKRRRTGKTKSGLVRDPRWIRFFSRLAYFGVPALVVLLAVTYFVVAASTGTGRFQEGVARTLTRDLDLESVAIKDTKLRALSLMVGQAAMQGKPGSMIRTAEFQEVEMRLNPGSFLGGSWQVEGCAIANLKVSLAAPLPVAVAALNRARATAAGFLLADEPERIHFSDVTVAQADIVFGVPANSTAAARDALPGLRKVRLSLLERPSEDGSPTYFDLQIGGGRDGTLTLPGWPALRIEVLRAELRSDGAKLKRSAFQFAAPVENKPANAPVGFIEAQGTIPSAPGATAELLLDLNNVNLADILPKNVNRYLSGTLNAEGLRLTWRTSDPLNTWTIEGPITVRRTQIRELAALNGLGDITAGELAGLDFDETSAVLNLTPEGTRISEIKARGIGRAYVTGEMRIASNGKLDGQIQIGISQDSLMENPPPFFKPGEESAAWTSVILSGTTTNPGEDLSERINAWDAARNKEGSSARPTPPGETTPGGEPGPVVPGPTPDDPAAKDEKALELLYKELLKDE
ncbi:MAG: hypothetical protein ACKO2G_07880 [Verrucomicrobiales bacterium]